MKWEAGGPTPDQALKVQARLSPDHPAYNGGAEVTGSASLLNKIAHPADTPVPSAHATRRPAGYLRVL